jgi:hypothetical protein
MNHNSTTKKPNAISKLRQVIREEVRNAVKEEMVPILLEVIKNTNKPIVEGTVPAFLQNMNKASAPSSKIEQQPHSSTNSILEETRLEMMQAIGAPQMEEYRTMLSANTGNMNMFRENTLIQQQEQQPGDVNAMLANARKASKEEYVEITDVPDFSHLVKKMNL